MRKAKRIRTVQTGMEKALGWPNCSFPVTEEAYRKNGKKLSTRAWSGQEVIALN